MADQKQSGIVLVDPKTIWGDLQKFKPEMEAALPHHITPDRMARLALTALRTNPKLFNCTRESFMGALVLASQMGLEPGVMGQCYLIPYKQTCTLVPGWRGLLDLVKRTGRATASSRAIFDGDEYDFAFGDRPFVHHRPGKNYGVVEAMIYTYAVGKVKGFETEPEIDVWDIDRIWKHRNRQNKVGDLHYSHAYPEQYARKIPLLQVLKYLPTSIELAEALTLEGDGKARPLDFTGAITDGVLKEAEVEQAMEALGWESDKREAFREQYAGRSEEAVAYLKGETAKASKASPKSPASAKQNPPKEERAPQQEPQHQAQPATASQSEATVSQAKTTQNSLGEWE